MVLSGRCLIFMLIYLSWRGLGHFFPFCTARVRQGPYMPGQCPTRSHTPGLEFPFYESFLSICYFFEIRKQFQEFREAGPGPGLGLELVRLWVGQQVSQQIFIQCLPGARQVDKHWAHKRLQNRTAATREAPERSLDAQQSSCPKWP